MKGAFLVAVIVVAVVTAVAMRDRNCHFNVNLIGRVYCTDDG